MIEQHGRLFRAALLATFALLVYMLLPFLAVLLTAAVLVLVTWPLHVRLARAIGRIPGALLATLLLVGAILVPAALAAWLAIREAADAVNELVRFVADGGLRALAERDGVPEVVRELVENGIDWSALPVGDVLKTAANALAQVGGAVQVVMSGSVQLAMAVAAMGMLYLEGPRLLGAIRQLRPLPDEYLDELFAMFRAFANNVIVGMLATACGQGAVASLGFWLAGADRVALLGLATALFSQMPIVGSAFVWVPVVVVLASDGRWGRAVFVAVWSVALTATVDNVLKPLVYHRGLHVHPVLVLMSLLSGVVTFGPAGVLLGPLALVSFLTLWTLYERDVLRPGAGDRS